MKSVLYKKCGIYKIICTKTNKIYVGSSCNIYSRWMTHLTCLKLNTHDNPKLQNAYNKYGKHNFIIKIIEICSRNKLLIREQYYLDKLTPFSTNGYNINKMASCGPYMGKEIILMSPDGIICKADSAHQFIEKYNLPHKAIGPICEVRDNPQRIYLGWRNPKCIKKLKQLKDPNGNIHTIIQNRTFAKIHNLNEYCLSALLHGNIHEHKGWVLPHNTPKIYKLKNIINNKIYKFNSIKQFAIDNKLNKASIQRVLSKKQKKYNNWVYP